jgi:hypothetical protein
MALSDDQRAMLRLLAQREQGYDDLAALMGLSVDEVRAKVKEALNALEEGEEAPPLPAEPVAPAPPAPQPEEPAVVEKPAEPVAEKTAVSATPKAPESATSAPPRKRPSSSSPPKLSMPSGRGPRAAIAAGAAVVVLVIVLLAVGGSDGGSGSDSTTTVNSAAAGETTAEEGLAASVANSKDVTQATLAAVDGSDASGIAVFGRVKNTLALQVEAEGLAPTAQGQSYTIWMADSPQKMLPLASAKVSDSGKLGAQFEVPTEVLAYLAGETFDQIVVTLTSNAALKASLDKATKEKKAPAYTGTEALRGTITGPIVGAAKKEAAAKK